MLERQKHERRVSGTLREKPKVAKKDPRAQSVKLLKHAPPGGGQQVKFESCMQRGCMRLRSQNTNAE